MIPVHFQRRHFLQSLVLVGALVLACVAKAPSDPPMSEGFLTAEDSVRLFYRTVGDGRQTVILPGDLFLHPAFDRLARGRTLVYYDMRNRGQSDALGEEQANSIQQDVADLETVRRHFGVERCDLVGFSYLGLMVAMYAAEHPERVRRIVQLGPAPMVFGTEYPKGLGAPDYEAALDSWELANLRKLQGEGLPETDPRAYCEREWDVTRFALVGDPAHVDRLHGSPCDMPNEWPTHLAAHFARHFPSVKNLSMDRDAFARIDAPVLTIHGTMDRNAAYGSGREWAMTVRDGRLITVPGAAHCSWADDPDLVLGAVETFLSGHWPDAAEKVTQMETAQPAPE